MAVLNYRLRDIFAQEIGNRHFAYSILISDTWWRNAQQYQRNLYIAEKYI